VIRSAHALAVLAACGSSTSKPETTAPSNKVSTPEPDDGITHLQVVIEQAYDDACPASHRFVVYVDGVERGVVEPACKEAIQIINGKRMVVTDSGMRTADIPAFDVPPGKHTVSARDTITGWVAGEKELTFPQREPGRPEIKHEILPIHFGFDVNDNPKHYVRELVYGYATM
jgi:hypothetical protein